MHFKLLLFGFICKSLPWLVTGGSKYEPIQVPSALWHKMIESETSFAVNSALECASVCEAKGQASCDLWVKQDDRCFLGQFSGSHTYLADQGVDSVCRVKSASLVSMLSSNYYEILELDQSPFFVDMITSSVSAESFWICQAFCQTGCDFFVHEETTCHMGSTTQSGGSAALELTSGWNLYLKTVSYPDLPPNQLLSNSLPTRPTSYWCFYIYEMIQVKDKDHCMAQCIFRNDDQCHYTIFDTDKCFLGNFNHLANNFSTCSSGIREVFLMKDMSALKTGPNSASLLTTPGKFGPFITNTSTSFNTDEECMALCNIHYRQDCHFALLDSSSSSCYFGNFLNTAPQLSPLPASSQTLFMMNYQINRDNIANDIFIMVTMKRDIWNTKSHDAKPASSEDECASFCLLLPSDCDMFHFEGSTCELGLSTNTLAYTLSVESINVFVRKDKLSSEFETQVLGSGWSKYLYKSLTMAYNTDPEATIACSANCLLDDSFCSIALWRDSTCYLGDWNVNSQIFNVPTTLAKVRRPLAGLLQGGKDIDGAEVAEVGDLHFESGASCQNDGVLPPADINREGHGLLYVHPWLLMCGGSNNGNIKSECQRMDMTADQRRWIAMANSPVTRSDFIFLANGNGFAYAFGGRDKAALGFKVTVNRVDRYNIATDSWTNVGSIPEGQFGDGCGVVIDDIFWIIGGKRYTSGLVPAVQKDVALRHVYTFNPGVSPEWTAKTPLPNDYTSDAFCSDFKDPVTGNTWIIVAGGKIEEVASDQVIYYDVTLDNSVWNSLEPLPAKMANAPATHTIFKFNDQTLKVYAMKSDLYEFDQNKILAFDANVKKFEYQTLPQPKTILGRSSALTMFPMHLVWTCVPASPHWTLMMNHHATSETKFFNFGELNRNPGHPTVDRHMVMDQLNNYKSCDNRYHFKLVYPELGYYNEWYQTSDPTISVSVTDYQAVSVKFTEYFIGLRKSTLLATTMTGDQNLGQYYYAVGQTQLWKTNAYISGPPVIYGLTKVQLYIKKDC